MPRPHPPRDTPPPSRPEDHSEEFWGRGFYGYPDPPPTWTADDYIRRIIGVRLRESYLCIEDMLARSPAVAPIIVPEKRRRAGVTSRNRGCRAVATATRWERARLFDCVFELLEQLFRIRPAIAKAEVLALVHQCWPSPHGDAAHILAAHEALIRENPTSRGCKGACSDLAERLGVSRATIRRAIRRARAGIKPRSKLPYVETVTVIDLGKTGAADTTTTVTPPRTTRRRPR